MHGPDESAQAEGAISDLWRFYDEHAAQARQHETLRATVTSTLGAFAAALVGFAGVGGLERADAPAGALLIVFGLLGAPLSLKHYERNRFHTKVMSTVRDEIATLRGNPGHAASTHQLRKRAKKEHQQEFSLRQTRAEKTKQLPPLQSKTTQPVSWVVRVNLWQLWAALPLAITVVGVVILIASLSSDK